MQHKLVFIETPDVVETTLALDNYRKACDCGRGAVFFSVARFVLLTASLRPPFKIHYQSAAEPMIGMLETFVAYNLFLTFDPDQSSYHYIGGDLL